MYPSHTLYTYLANGVSDYDLRHARVTASLWPISSVWATGAYQLVADLKAVIDFASSRE